MIPVKQIIKHDPPRAYGDCHRAAIASILELPCEAVPHFINGPDEEVQDWKAAQNAWLITRCIVPIDIPATGELSNILATMPTYYPGIYFLLGGTSRLGTGHTVVCLDGKIVHDPSPLTAASSGQ